MKHHATFMTHDMRKQKRREAPLSVLHASPATARPELFTLLLTDAPVNHRGIRHADAA